MVVFEDEASLSNTATVSYSWSKRGEQPKVCQTQRKKERKTIFGCVCPHTGELVTQVAEHGNTITFFSFLLTVVQAFHGKKVYMVLREDMDMLMEQISKHLIPHRKGKRRHYPRKTKRGKHQKYG